MRGLVGGSAVVVTAALIACANASGDLSGGQAKLDTTPPPFNPPTQDAAPAAVDEGSGSKWSDLYRDLFGPTGHPPSCSFQSDCHGSPEGEGAKSPAGIKCFDQTGCRQSFFDTGLLKPADKDDPGNSVLLAGLLRIRRPDGSISGFMPDEPRDYVFSDKSVERIKEWIKNGAPND
jgi:hypothetical protein